MRLSIEVIREAFQAGRPSMSLVTAFVYLYNNKDPSLWMTLYFGFIFQLCCKGGNDFMDWATDSAHEEGGLDESRGKAQSKELVWPLYVFASVVTLVLGLFVDPLFGRQYFVIVELAGHCAYNGLLVGYRSNGLSFVKAIGSPLAIMLSALTYAPFPYLVGQQRWTPNLTIFAWGVTVTWGQLKDYKFIKSASARSTSNFLGEFCCTAFVSVSAVIMMWQDRRFTPHGLYTIYRCYLYVQGIDHKAKGKMSDMVGLNLVAIVFCDPSIPGRIKFISLGAHLTAYLGYRYSYEIEQKWFAIMGIINRRRPYSKSVWDETDPNVLLWKVGTLTGRSGSAVTGLFRLDVARISLLNYVYFRCQDTWADVCLNSEDRIRGIKLLQYRLIDLLTGTLRVGEPEQEKEYNVEWDFSRPRNTMYVDITKNVHRFDEVFLNLPSHHKEIVMDFVNGMSNGFIELEKLKDEPVTDSIMRKHAEAALDVGFFAFCRILSTDLYGAIHQSTSSDPTVRAGYVAFSDFIWLMNLVATMEEDIREGIIMDEELRAMHGCLEPDVVKRVRIKWLLKALTVLRQAKPFLNHASLVENWMVRLLVYHFANVSAGVVERYVREFQGRAPLQKSGSTGSSLLLRTVVQGLNRRTYSIGISEFLDKSDVFLSELQAMQSKEVAQ